MPEKKGPTDISKILKETKGGGLKKPVKAGKPLKKEEAKPAEAPKPEEITAELVSSKEFGKKVQGYDPAEVRAFLQAVAQRLLQLEAAAQGGASSEELEALKKRVAELEEENRRLREAKSVDETEEAMSILKHAKEAAEKLRQEAEAKAKEIVESAEKEALLRKAKLEQESKELQEQVERLRSFKLELVAKMEGVLEELRSSLEKYKE